MTLIIFNIYFQNAGFPQGRLVRRAQIPRDTSGTYYSWKDFNVGIDVMIYGLTYHICSCDEYTKVSTTPEVGTLTTVSYNTAVYGLEAESQV